MTTIAEKLTTIKNALTAIKNSIISKGQTPTGDITTYASAILNIESGGGSSSNFVGIPREVTSNGVFGFPIENFIFTLPSNAKDVENSGLQYAFYQCPTLESVNLSSLQTISGDDALNKAFYRCDTLTNVDLSNLTTITGSLALYYAFWECTSLTSVDLYSLTTVRNIGALRNAFQGCRALKSVDLSNLTELSGGYDMDCTFYGCISLSSVDLSGLQTVSNEYSLYCTFQNCTSLTELSFPALTSKSFGSYTNQFNGMLRRVKGCTVHFPSNLESVIGSWSDVTSGFGGNSTQILFDLTPTS